MDSTVESGGAEWSNKQRQARGDDSPEREAKRKRDLNFRKSFHEGREREREREKYSVTPFPGIIEDPCGPSSLMARYRTVPLLDNRQILLFMNVAGPSSRHRRRISLSFVDYTHRRLYGDCRLQSRPRHVSKIVFHETYPRTLMLSIKID